MEFSEIRENLGRTAQISDEDASLLLENAILVNFKKNKHVLEVGKTATYMYLIKSGCLMTYFLDKQGGLHALQFGTDMWWTGDMEGFINRSGSVYGVKAILDSEVLLVDLELLNTLTNQAPAYERYFRIIFQNALISHQKRIMRNISLSAEERYEEFIRLYPKMELIIPQKYIASYLGITPEFLSKLRRKRAGK